MNLPPPDIKTLIWLAELDQHVREIIRELCAPVSLCLCPRPVVVRGPPDWREWYRCERCGCCVGEIEVVDGTAQVREDARA